MSNESRKIGKKWLQAVLCTVFLMCSCLSGYAQDGPGSHTIELESEGAFRVHVGA